MGIPRYNLYTACNTANPSLNMVFSTAHPGYYQLENINNPKNPVSFYHHNAVYGDWIKNTSLRSDGSWADAGGEHYPAIYLIQHVI